MDMHENTFGGESHEILVKEIEVSLNTGPRWLM